jgi:hypothetical protein
MEQMGISDGILAVLWNRKLLLQSQVHCNRTVVNYLNNKPITKRTKQQQKRIDAREDNLPAVFGVT